MTPQVSILAALSAGFVSFISPCVLPLIPGYVSFLAGLAADGGEEVKGRRALDVLLPALLFVAGFTLVFVALGASASLVGAWLRPFRQALTVAGGVLVVTFGVLLLRVIPLPWLYSEARLDLAKVRGLGHVAAPAMGMAFAFAWTPCVGPILGPILMMAGSQADAGRGALLLLAYSAGLAVPFLVTALAVDRLRGVIGRLARYGSILSRVAGAVLIAFGLLMASGRLAVLSAWLTKTFPGLVLH